LLVAAAHADELKALISALNDREVRYFGAVFPGLIEGAQRRDEGVIVQPVPLVGELAIADLDGEAFRWVSPLPSLELDVPGQYVLMVFVDFWTRCIPALLSSLFDSYAGGVQYFGAGAGVGGRRTSHCLFTSAGTIESGALVALVNLDGELRLRHGWRRIHGPLVATSTKGSEIHELNWRPAAEVYREIVQELGYENASDEELMGRNKRHALAISRDDNEDIVRDPIGFTSDGGLACLSHVPENSVMHITEGDVSALTDAAREALTDCASGFSGAAQAQCLVWDCYSRTLLMKEEFEHELEAAREALQAVHPTITMEGAIALGEIASNGERIPDLHNKTFAVGLFRD